MRVRTPSPSPAFRRDFTPPSLLRLAAWRLAPLHPDLAEVDYAAWRGCRVRLVAELGWGGWPGPEFTLVANRTDLAEHYTEFEGRTAYAYSVIGPKHCLGCVYIEPWRQGAQLAFWVTDAALPIEGEVVGGVLDWLGVAWPIDRVVLPLHADNHRGRVVLESLGLVPCPGPEGRVSFTRD